MAIIGEVILAETASADTQYVEALETQTSKTMQAFARSLSECITRGKQEAIRGLGLQLREQERGLRTVRLW